VIDELAEVRVYPARGRLAERTTCLADEAAPQRNVHFLGWVAARLAPVHRHPGAPGNAADPAVDCRPGDALVLDAPAAQDELATVGEVVVPEQVRQPLLNAGSSPRIAVTRRDEVVDDARPPGTACELDQPARDYAFLGVVLFV
jgi:hypothetical protein